MDSDISKIYKSMSSDAHDKSKQLKDCYSSVYSDIEHEHQSNITESYQDVYSDKPREVSSITNAYNTIYEAKASFKSKDDKSINWSGEIDDHIAKKLIKYAEANDFYKHFPKYLSTLGYKNGNIPAAIEKYFVENLMARPFAPIFDKLGEGLPKLDHYVKHGNKIDLRPGSSDSPFKGLLKQLKVDSDTLQDLVDLLFSNKDMPKKGQNIGNGEIVLLLLFADTFQPGVGDVKLVGGEKGDIGIHGEKGSYLLEVKDGMPRAGSGDAVYSGTVPAALMSRLFDGADIDDIENRITGIKDRVKDQLKQRELKYRVLTNYNTQNNVSLIKMGNYITDAVLPRGFTINDLVPEDENTSKIIRIFNNADLLNGLFADSSDSAVKILDSLTLRDELSSRIGFDEAEQLASDIMTMTKQVLVINNDKQIFKSLAKNLFGAPPAGDTKKYTLSSEALNDLNKKIQNKIESVENLQVTAGGTYGDFVTQYFDVLNSDDTTLYPGSEAHRKKAVADGLYILRNFGNTAKLEAEEYSLAGDIRQLVEHHDTQWIVDNIKLIVGAIHLICYQIDEEFEEILFFSNKTTGAGIFVNPKSFGEHRIAKLIEFFNTHNFKADLSIDSSRPVGVHVWYN